MNQRFDVCIIGGGAAALAAAASLDRRVSACILEKNQILGRKILATGGGRCNLTNAGCQGFPATLDFFASYGLETICDSEGRYYPYSGCASEVVRVLETAVRSGNCTVLTETAAEAVERNASGEGFRIRTSGSTIEAGMILLAAGGKAAPKFGTTGDGYRLAKQLGHHVTRLYPILTGIECGDFRDLKGIRARGKVTLLEDGQVRAEETGEIQFTQDGLSGICVFNLTPQIHAREGEPPAEAMKRYLTEDALMGLDGDTLIDTPFRQDREIRFQSYHVDESFWTPDGKEVVSPVIYVASSNNMSYFEAESLVATGIPDSYLVLTESAYQKYVKEGLPQSLRDRKLTFSGVKTE